jgi:hypothetical protein
MRRCRWKKVSVWLWSGVQFGLWPTVSRGKVRGWLLRDVNWPQSKQGGPVRPPRGGPPYRATGERSNYIGPQAVVHWQSGGAVGVCLGRNNVARASRCDWLHGLGSRRSKSLMPERNEPVIVIVRAFNDLSECWRRKSKQKGRQSNLRLSHSLHSLCLK